MIGIVKNNSENFYIAGVKFCGLNNQCVRCSLTVANPRIPLRLAAAAGGFTSTDGNEIGAKIRAAVAAAAAALGSGFRYRRRIIRRNRVRPHPRESRRRR